METLSKYKSSNGKIKSNRINAHNELWMPNAPDNAEAIFLISSISIVDDALSELHQMLWFREDISML